MVTTTLRHHQFCTPFWLVIIVAYRDKCIGIVRKSLQGYDFITKIRGCMCRQLCTNVCG